MVGALLVLSIFVGIEPNENSSFFPFKLNNADRISELLALSLVYCASQTILYWAGENTEVRTRSHFRNDHFLSLGIAGIAILIWVSEWLVLLIDSLMSILPEFKMLVALQKTESILVGLSSVFAAISIGYLGSRFQSIAVKSVQHRRDVMADKEQQLLEALLNNKWTLIFNPQSKNGRKEISFNDDGSIGTGGNTNETVWRVRGDFLEILNSSSDIQSRFKFDSELLELHHTNDDDTLSLRNQKIVRDLAD